MCADRDFSHYRLALTLLRDHVLKVLQSFGRFPVPTSAHLAQGQKGRCAPGGGARVVSRVTIDKEEYAV
jgi:hypothetical protein